MDKHHSPLVLCFLLALAGACGGDDEPRDKPRSDASTNDDDDGDGDDDPPSGEQPRSDAGSGSMGGDTKEDGGRSPTNPRDASSGSSDARVDSGNTDRDSGTTMPEPDSGTTTDPGPTACDTSKAPTIPPLALETVVGGLERLTFAAQPPGSSDWYLLQQTGQIRVFRDGKLQEQPFLDLSSEITLTIAGMYQDERGLLGLAFPADYASSGKFYVMVTPTKGAGANSDTIREYQRSDDANKANPTPTKTLLQLPPSDFNHNGGNILFGPDGMLYVGTGDGGGTCNSNQANAPQDVKSLFGKILRLDPNGTAPNYAAAGNPFASGGDARVLHYGLRNPFRWGFDRLTGDLYIGDVGQDAYEEISFASKDQKGVNFGWSAFEGNHPTSETCARGRGQPFKLRDGSTHTAPIWEADRRRGQTTPYSDWVSVIGGRVYRGSAIGGLRGTYITGDFSGKRMIALVHCEGKMSPVTPILKVADPNTPNVAAFTQIGGGRAFTNLTAIFEDNAGELYLLADFNRLLKVVPRP